MGKSIKITESQLKRLLKVTINEQRTIKSLPEKKGLKMMDMISTPISKN